MNRFKGYDSVGYLIGLLFVHKVILYNETKAPFVDRSVVLWFHLKISAACSGNKAEIRPFLAYTCTSARTNWSSRFICLFCFLLFSMISLGCYYDCVKINVGAYFLSFYLSVSSDRCFSLIIQK